MLAALAPSPHRIARFVVPQRRLSSGFVAAAENFFEGQPIRLEDSVNLVAHIREVLLGSFQFSLFRFLDQVGELGVIQ